MTTELPYLHVRVSNGKQYRIERMPPEWAGFPIRAWFWNGDLGDWDEVVNVSRLQELAALVGVTEHSS